MSAPTTVPHRDKTPDRDAWLAGLAADLRGWYSQAGVHLPRTVHVFAGWGHNRRHNEGPDLQAHMVSGTNTEDGWPQVFISPVESDADRVAAYLGHMLVHTALDPDLSHRADFSQAARAVGLTGRPTAPTLGLELREQVGAWIVEAGPYPGPAVGMLIAPVINGVTATTPAEQSTRWIPARCPTCPGFRTKHRTVQLSKATADEGPPICGRVLDAETGKRCMNVMIVDLRPAPGTRPVSPQ